MKKLSICSYHVLLIKTLTIILPLIGTQSVPYRILTDSILYSLVNTLAVEKIVIVLLALYNITKRLIVTSTRNVFVAVINNNRDGENITKMNSKAHHPRQIKVTGRSSE